MTETLVVDSMLWEATPPDLQDGSDPSAVDVLVVAWFVNALAKGEGLSDASEAPLATRFAVPAGFVPFLSHYFSDLYGEEYLRNTLYTALVEVAAAPKRRETTDMLLGISQVYWALSYDRDDRHDLPMKGGRELRPKNPGDPVQLAYIGIDELDGDFARVKRLDERALLAKGMFKASDRVLFKTSGSGLRRRGAGIAVQVARHIVRTTPEGPSPLGDARLQAVGSKHELRLSSAAGRLRPPSTPPPSLAPRQSNELQALVDKLTLLAEALPHENAHAQAAALLIAGFQSTRAGEREQAMSQFWKSAEVSETLGALHPEDPGHDVLLVMALLMNASVRLMSGSDAGVLLHRAASLSVDLADRDDDHADLAATALTLEGFLDIQLGDFENARRRMRRAVNISTKITRRPDSDPSSEGLLVSSLAGLALVELHEGLADEAKISIAQALTLSGRAHAANPEDFSLALVHSGLLATSSEVFDQLDKPEDGLAAAASAASIAQNLEANDHSRFTLGISQVAAARCCMSLDRTEDAIEWLSGAVVQFEQLSDPQVQTGAPLDVTSLQAGALLTRGALLDQVGRFTEAEASLLRVAGVLEGRTELKDRLVVSQSLTMLADLYQATDRESLATFAAQRADDVMREALGLPLTSIGLEGPPGVVVIPTSARGGTPPE